jgi:hypothetical protein
MRHYFYIDIVGPRGLRPPDPADLIDYNRQLAQRKRRDDRKRKHRTGLKRPAVIAHSILKNILYYTVHPMGP